MDEKFEGYNEEQISNMVSRFEEMIGQGKNHFFDMDEFEVIIDFYLETNNLKNADIALKRAIQQYPKAVSLLLKKAQYFAFSNKTEKALDLLSEIESLEPFNTDVFFTRGAIYSQMQKYEKAIEEYNKAISSNEDLEDVYSNIAFEYENLGNYSKAIDYLKKVLEINPENESSIYELDFKL